MQREQPVIAETEAGDEQSSAPVKVVVVMAEVAGKSELQSLILENLCQGANSVHADQTEVEAQAISAQCMSLNDDNVLGNIRSLLGSGGNIHIIALYQSPVSVLLDAINSDSSVDNALDQWSSTARELIAVFRQYRGQVTITSVEACLSNPEQFAAALGRQMDLTFEPSEWTVAGAGSNVNPFAFLLAEHWLRGDPEYRDLAGDLEACSLPLASPPIFSQHQLLEECRRLTGSGHVSALHGSDNPEQLKSQLLQLQEEYETCYFRAQRLSRKFDTLNEKQLDFLSKNRELPALEWGDANIELEVMARALHELHQSMSWKVTAPLRFVYGLLIGSWRR